MAGNCTYTSYSYPQGLPLSPVLWLYNVYTKGLADLNGLNQNGLSRVADDGLIFVQLQDNKGHPAQKAAKAVFIYNWRKFPNKSRQTELSSIHI